MAIVFDKYQTQGALTGQFSVPIPFGIHSFAGFALHYQDFTAFSGISKSFNVICFPLLFYSFILCETKSRFRVEYSCSIGPRIFKLMHDISENIPDVSTTANLRSLREILKVSSMLKAEEANIDEMAIIHRAFMSFFETQLTPTVIQDKFHVNSIILRPF